MKNSKETQSNGNEILNSRNLTIVNFAIIAYFSINYLIYVFEIRSVILGVINEMVTLPLMVLQLVFLIIGIIQIIKKPTNHLMVFSLVLLTICAVVTIGSFF